MSKTRVRLAFLLAPLGPALYLVAVQLLSQSSGRYSLAMPLLFALPISYLSCVAFGVPLLRILRSRGALSAIAVVAVGSLLGIIVNYLLEQSGTDHHCFVMSNIKGSGSQLNSTPVMPSHPN